MSASIYIAGKKLLKSIKVMQHTVQLNFFPTKKWFRSAIPNICYVNPDP